MRIRDEVEKAFKLIGCRAGSKYNTGELLVALEKAGIEWLLAYKIIEMMPIAFGRVYLKNEKLQLPQEFSFYIPGERKEIIPQSRKLTDDPVYNECFDLAEEIAQSNESSAEFLAIASESKEVKHFKKFAGKIVQTETIVFSKLDFPYVEE